MMDTKRFELTDEEIYETLFLQVPSEALIIAIEEGDRRLVQAQVAKVLSLLGPVELETLEKRR